MKNVDAIHFADIEAAKAFRNDNGGWIFHAIFEQSAIWFNWHFTPSAIFRHDATRGKSGQLI